MRTRFRIALAEGSFLIREALIRLLQDEDDVELVAVCGHAAELREVVRSRDVDVVVTGDEGVRIARELHRTHPDVGVILLGASRDSAYVPGLLESGTERRAYLLKERVHSGRELMATIRAVACGGAVIDPKIVESHVRGRAPPGPSRIAGLSPHEQEVLAAMARGDSNAAIARALGTSRRAVEKDVEAIFAKLALPATRDVSRRVRAVLAFLSETSPPRV
jgi:DNA-binding NarL/FixJ family response regulator